MNRFLCALFGHRFHGWASINPSTPHAPGWVRCARCGVPL